MEQVILVPVRLWSSECSQWNKLFEFRYVYGARSVVSGTSCLSAATFMELGV